MKITLASVCSIQFKADTIFSIVVVFAVDTTAAAAAATAAATDVSLQPIEMARMKMFITVK